MSTGISNGQTLVKELGFRNIDHLWAVFESWTGWWIWTWSRSLNISPVSPAGEERQTNSFRFLQEFRGHLGAPGTGRVVLMGIMCQSPYVEDRVLFEEPLAGCRQSDYVLKSTSCLCTAYFYQNSCWEKDNIDSFSGPPKVQFHSPHLFSSFAKAVAISNQNEVTWQMLR